MMSFSFKLPLVILVFFASACSTSSTGGVESSVQTPTSSSTTTTSLPVATVDSTANANPLGGNSPEDFLMPDVLCMNLQEAQDEIQDRGVLFSRSEDASGRNRMQINDSNWIVVKQSPAPGTKITEGDALLSVVKIGEPTNGVCP